MSTLLETAANRGIVPSKNFILAHTLPIVSESEELQRVDGHSSCFFIRVCESVFLVTAAHVSDDAKKQRLMYFVPEEVAFESNSAVITQAPFGKRNEDHVDIIVLKLASEIVNKINSGGIYSFFNVLDLDCGAPKKKGSLFTFAGFPHSKYEYDRAKLKFLPNAISHLGMSVANEEYTKADVDVNTSIVIRYDRTRTKTEDGKTLLRSFYPQGMSGGPVFHRNKLCGVIIEYQEQYARFIATRIEVIVRMIQDQWPETASHLPNIRISFVRNA